MKIYKNIFDRIISLENLFSAWDAFRSDKRNKRDVLQFEWHLEENIFQLHRELKNKIYQHGPYTSFYINDPKQRHIYKASVRDRVLHHAVFSVMNPLFEETFIPTSFSCRVNYGTHKGIEFLERMMRATMQNGTRDCFVLKCDIQKFFDSVDHKTLIEIISRRIKDQNVIKLLKSVVESYAAGADTRERERERVNLVPREGIPIGNLTSQLFANIYMNEFDQFMKCGLHIKHYVRYTDDFAIVSSDRVYLKSLIKPMSKFLDDYLSLNLHPKKIFIRKLNQGIDFLGYIIFPKHRLLRTKTKRRMLAKFTEKIVAYRMGGSIRKIFYGVAPVLFRCFVTCKYCTIGQKNEESSMVCELKDKKIGGRNYRFGRGSLFV